ncbi:MAG TPA: hypothetical protein PKH77_24975 [Anaerolineae bacterium]|nr:hypothetical protein [Anaerolineae bacterium]
MTTDTAVQLERENAILALPSLRRVELTKRDNGKYFYLIATYAGNEELGYMAMLDKEFSDVVSGERRKFYCSLAQSDIVAERNDALRAMAILLSSNVVSFYKSTMNETGKGTLAQAANAVESVYNALSGYLAVANLLDDVGEPHRLIEPFDSGVDAILNLLAPYVGQVR